MTTSTTSLEHFGAKLLTTIVQQNKNQNIFLSSISITLAVSTCTIGAQHETLQQMLRTLEVPSTEELIGGAEQVMQVLTLADQDKSNDKKFTDEPVTYDVHRSTPLRLKLANRLYAASTYQLQEAFQNVIEKSFHTNIQLEDFQNESVKAVQAINSWVEKQTNERIRHVISKDDMMKDIRLILINCIYFKGTWLKKFLVRKTDRNADFYGTNGVTSKIELMFQRGYFDYAENDDLRIQVAHLPYVSLGRNTKCVFTVVLPNQGVSLDEVENKLSADFHLRQEILNHRNANSKELLLYIPKFKLETKYELTDILVALGMKDAFDDKKADFEVIHQTFVSIDEEGTEAAATIGVMTEACGFALNAKKLPVEFKWEIRFTTRSKRMKSADRLRDVTKIRIKPRLETFS